MSWNFTASYRGFACKGGPALSQILQCSKYIISGRRGFCSARNTLFLAVADFTMLEIHYFWPPRILQRSKYTISGRRGFCSARNTLFLAVAEFTTPEIHYFRPPQNLHIIRKTICPKSQNDLSEDWGDTTTFFRTRRFWVVCISLTVRPVGHRCAAVQIRLTPHLLCLWLGVRGLPFHGRLG